METLSLLLFISIKKEENLVEILWSLFGIFVGADMYNSIRVIAPVIVGIIIAMQVFKAMNKENNNKK